VIHAVLVLMCGIRYGSAAFAFVFHPIPSMGGPAGLFPSDFGYRLRTAYGVWIVILALLYPLCVWFSRFKLRHSYWWLRYL
jgi:hypothetical protein